MSLDPRTPLFPPLAAPLPEDEPAPFAAAFRAWPPDTWIQFFSAHDASLEEASGERDEAHRPTRSAMIFTPFFPADDEVPASKAGLESPGGLQGARDWPGVFGAAALSMMYRRGGGAGERCEEVRIDMPAAAFMQSELASEP